MLSPDIREDFVEPIQERWLGVGDSTAKLSWVGRLGFDTKLSDTAIRVGRVKGQGVEGVIKAVEPSVLLKLICD